MKDIRVRARLEAYRHGETVIRVSHCQQFALQAAKAISDAGSGRGADAQGRFGVDELGPYLDSLVAKYEKECGVKPATLRAILLNVLNVRLPE